MDVVSAVITAILAAIGLASVVRALITRLFGTADDSAIVYIAAIKSGDSAEVKLRNAVSRVKWSGGHGSVVCLDCGMNENEREICRKICRDCGFGDLMSKKEFANKLLKEEA